MRHIITFFRIIVGSVLVVSGLIKANDALGFSYKMEEYFEPAALDMPFFMDYALAIAVIVCVVEVVLGLSLLFGTKFKITTILVFLMFVFFGFLTYYTAQCDPHEMITYINKAGETITENTQCVLDCGCFGDALHLEPMQSFWKDIALLLMTLPLFLGFNSVKLNNERYDRYLIVGSILFTLFFSGYLFDWFFPVLFIAVAGAITVIFKFFYAKKRTDLAIIGLASILTSAFVYYTLTFLPIKDFRAYAEGNNLPELMKTSETLQEEIYQVEFERIMPLYKQKIKDESHKLIMSNELLNSDSLSEEQKTEIKENIHQDITSKYETVADSIAMAFAADSMVRGNLLPPVFASTFFMENKETKERKEILSTDYLEQKLWKTWDMVYQMKNKKTGESKITKSKEEREKLKEQGFKEKNYPPVKLKDGREPAISPDFDFNDEKINQEVLHGDEYLILVVTWDLDKSREKSFIKLNNLYKHSQEKGYKFYGATSTLAKSEAFKKNNKVEFKFASADEKILKTIVRSNPGVLLIKNGIVVKKWGKNTIPSSKKLEKVIAKYEAKQIK